MLTLSSVGPSLVLKKKKELANHKNSTLVSALVRGYDVIYKHDETTFALFSPSVRSATRFRRYSTRKEEYKLFSPRGCLQQTNAVRALD